MLWCMPVVGGGCVARRWGLREGGSRCAARTSGTLGMLFSGEEGFSSGGGADGAGGRGGGGGRGGDLYTAASTRLI